MIAVVFYSSLTNGSIASNRRRNSSCSMRFCALASINSRINTGLTIEQIAEQLEVDVEAVRQAAQL
jgi:predicted transposase YdaD